MEARVSALEARLAAVESVAEGARHATARLADEHTSRWSEHAMLHQRDSQTHDRAHEVLLHQIESVKKESSVAINDAFEALGSIGAELATKARTLNDHAAQLEAAGRRIGAQAWVQSKIALLVIVGAAVGGGAAQVAIHRLTHREPAPVVNSPR